MALMMMENKTKQDKHGRHKWPQQAETKSWMHIIKSPHHRKLASPPRQLVSPGLYKLHSLTNKSRSCPANSHSGSLGPQSPGRWSHSGLAKSRSSPLESYSIGALWKTLSRLCSCAPQYVPIAGSTLAIRKRTVGDDGRRMVEDSRGDKV